MRKKAYQILMLTVVLIAVIGTSLADKTLQEHASEDAAGLLSEGDESENAAGMSSKEEQIDWEKEISLGHCSLIYDTEQVKVYSYLGMEYGIVGPDLSENDFVKAVREAGDYRKDKISHTYEYDYDGNGYHEAFVIIGRYMDMWGEVTKDQIYGELWFVDHDQNAVYLQKADFDAWQKYIRQDAYDGGYDTQAEYGWIWHTWKPYTFEFDHGKLREIGAKEVAIKDVVKIASLPEDFDEKEYDGVQYILRDNGEWELTDEGPGIYLIQLDGESHWEYLDHV